MVKAPPKKALARRQGAPVEAIGRALPALAPEDANGSFSHRGHEAVARGS
jgi:hypothetical protein